MGFWDTLKKGMDTASQYSRECMDDARRYEEQYSRYSTEDLKDAYRSAHGIEAGVIMKILRERGVLHS